MGKSKGKVIPIKKNESGQPKQPKRNVFSRMAATFEKAGIDWAELEDKGEGKRVKL